MTEELSKIIKEQVLLGQGCSYVRPELRYLVKEQAEEWIKIGKSVNTHTLSTENSLIKENILEVFPKTRKSLVIVDIGCGDGRKAAQVISDLLSKGHSVSKYVAVDFSKRLVDSAIELVTSKTRLSEENCISACVALEKWSDSLKQSWEISENEEVVYLFVGNTFNNFESEEILGILLRIVKQREKILIGIKCRKDSSSKERERIVKEYSSYGPDFTFSFGHLFGLSDNDMEREVEYNIKKNRLEIYLKVIKPSAFMIEKGIGKCKRLHVFNSYKPTIEGAEQLLAALFKVKVYKNPDLTEGIFFCTKK